MKGTHPHPALATLSDIPEDVVLLIWSLNAKARHDSACLMGANCVEPKLCPEAHSPERSFPFVSKRWRSVAGANPKIFANIRMKIHVGFRRVRNSNSLLIDNAPEVRAYKRLSGSSDIHLSIACSSDETESDSTNLEELTVAGLAERVTYLALDVDNERLTFQIGEVSFPNLKYVHLDKGSMDRGLEYNNAMVERFMFWGHSPIERIVCGHYMGVVLRANLSWAGLKILDLHGVHCGFREPSVEAVLRLAVRLEELRVGILGNSLNPGPRDSTWFATGIPQGIIKHEHLKVLFIEHQCFPSDSYELFKDAEFDALKTLNYDCRGTPSDKGIAWLMKRRPSVTSFSITPNYISHSRMASILSALPSLEALYYTACKGTSRFEDEESILDNTALHTLRSAPRRLKRVSLEGEVFFTPRSLTRFVGGRQRNLETIAIKEWVGPSLWELRDTQSAIRPATLEVRTVITCDTVRASGTRVPEDKNCSCEVGHDVIDIPRTRYIRYPNFKERRSPFFVRYNF